MARRLTRLTARGVATLKKPGRHADGGNLYLAITRTLAGLSKRWTFLFSFGGKQREAGLGPASKISLAEAREKADEYRSLLAKSIATLWPPRKPPRPPPTPRKHANIRPVRG